MASLTGRPSPSKTRQESHIRWPLACEDAMRATARASVVKPKWKKGPTVCEGVAGRSISSLEGRSFFASQNNVEFVAGGPLGLRGFKIEARDHALPGFFVG